MSRRARIAVVAIAAIALVLVVGQILVPGRPAARPSPATPAAAPGTGEAARPAVATVAAAPTPAPAPAAHARDAAGARSAAADFARSYATLVALSEPEAVALKRSMAAAAAADELVGAMLGRLGALRRVWPVGTLSYRVAPLAVRVAMEGTTAASADVWYVGVVAARGQPTYEEWVTQSYRLVWERDAWRIAAESDTSGPRPDPGRQSPASAAELDARLSGFEALA